MDLFGPAHADNARHVDEHAPTVSAATVDGLAPISMPLTEAVSAAPGCKSVSASSNRFPHFWRERRLQSLHHGERTLVHLCPLRSLSVTRVVSTPRSVSTNRPFRISLTRLNAGFSMPNPRSRPVKAFARPPPSSSKLAPLIFLSQSTPTPTSTYLSANFCMTSPAFLPIPFEAPVG